MRTPKTAVARTLACAALLLLPANVGRSLEVRMSPETILRRMAERYARARSYQDTGVVVVTDLQDGGRLLEEVPFKTYFKRPQLFRFEWSQHPFYQREPSQRVVLCDGQRTYTYWAPDRLEQAESLSMGIAGATGVSSGSAHTVARLLIRKVGGFAVSDLTNLQLVGVARFEGEQCYILSGKHPGGDTFELWVGKRDYLLRKLRVGLNSGGSKVMQEEIRRNIRIDGNLSNDIFSLKMLPLERKRKPTPLPSA